MDDATRNFVTNTLIDLSVIVEKLAAPKPVDWRAVARDAAVRIAAALWVEDNTAFSGSPEQVEAQRERYAQNIRSIAFREALALVAEMRKRAEFGGQP